MCVTLCVVYKRSNNYLFGSNLSARAQLSTFNNSRVLALSLARPGMAARDPWPYVHKEKLERGTLTPQDTKDLMDETGCKCMTKSRKLPSGDYGPRMLEVKTDVREHGVSLFFCCYMFVFAFGRLI